MTLTPQSRLNLFQTLNAIAPEQLEMIIFTLSPPPGIIPPLPTSQGQRVAALLNWVSFPNACGLVAVQQVLDEIVNLKVNKTANLTPESNKEQEAEVSKLQSALRRATIYKFGSLTAEGNVISRQTIAGKTIIGSQNNLLKNLHFREDKCPYKGLDYFDFNDEDPQFFYGREELTQALVNHVSQKNFLAILGASGSGKSSVLRAGLLHELKQGWLLSHSKEWKLLNPIIPGNHPLQNLAKAFVDFSLSHLEWSRQLGEAEEFLKQGTDGLRRLVEYYQHKRVILVIDQFEEVFTLCSHQTEREQFFQCLLGALEQMENKLCIILAMRADFFVKCLENEYSGLSKQIDHNLFSIVPMTEKQLTDVIALPADQVHLKIEPELIEQILKDIKDSPGSLPLLEYTLTELWKQRIDNCLKLTTYIKLGRIGGTLNQRATEVYQQLTPEEQKTAKHIFLSLTQLGEGTEDTRKRIFKQNLVTPKHSPDLIDKVVQKLASEKLIVTTEQLEKGSVSARVAVVDVAHEALIRNWKLLRQWLNKSRKYLLQQKEIEEYSIKWRNNSFKSEYYLQGKRLQEAVNFQKEFSEQFPLSQQATEFIEKSDKYQKASQLKNLGIFLIFPLIASILVGYFIFQEMQFYSDKNLITACTSKKDCAGRIEALERLVKANKSLKLYNLEKANLNAADLEKADLKGVNLYEAFLQGNNLKGAILSTAYLERADLKRANLSGANLSGANLNKTNLFKVELLEAYLKGANLSDANNLSNEQIKSACYWEEAVYTTAIWKEEFGWIAKDLQANQRKIEQIKQDKASNPTVYVDCSKWK